MAERTGAELFKILKKKGAIADLTTEEGREYCLKEITSSDVRKWDFGYRRAVDAEEIAGLYNFEDEAPQTLFKYLETHEHDLCVVFADEGAAPSLEHACANEYSREELDRIWGGTWPYHDRLQALHVRDHTSPQSMKALGYEPKGDE